MEDATYILRLEQIEIDEERLEGQPDDVEDLEVMSAIAVCYQGIHVRSTSNQSFIHTC